MSTDSRKTPLDALAPDYDKHPKFGKAKCADVTVAAGEMVYYPSFWWHQTQVRRLLACNRCKYCSVQMLAGFANDRCKCWSWLRRVVLSGCLERGVVRAVWQCLDTPTVNVNGLLLGVETVRHPSSPPPVTTQHPTPPSTWPPTHS